MLAKIPSWKLTEWMAYARLEPFGPERMEMMIAQFMALFYNANRDTKKGEPAKAEQFMLSFEGLLPEELRSDYQPSDLEDLDEETAPTFLPREHPIASSEQTNRMLESMRAFVAAFGGDDLTR